MSCDLGSNFYDVLGILPTASLTEIKQSYRKQALKYHPDRNLGNVDYATEIFKRIAEAYSILSDEGLRIKYDNKLNSAISLSSSNFSSKQDPKNDYSFYKANSASVPTVPAWTKTSSPHNNTNPSYSPPEPNPIIFSCSFSILKAHTIFNDFFTDFEEFEGGEVRNPYISIRNRNQANNSNQLVSYNPSVARNIRYSHSMSPSEQRLYRNLDVRDKYKNSTFNSWNPSDDGSSASPKPATQFLYVFGTDSEKNRNLKLVHRRRNMV